MSTKKNNSHKLYYSDATLTQGAWVNHKGNIMNFPLPHRFQLDMFHAEFYAAYRAIVDNGGNNEHVDLYCDNKGVCSMLNNRAAKHPLQYPRVSALLTKLLSWMQSQNITVSVLWIPSESNLADKPSRSALMTKQLHSSDMYLVITIVKLVQCAVTEHLKNKM